MCLHINFTKDIILESSTSLNWNKSTVRKIGIDILHQLSKQTIFVK